MKEGLVWRNASWLMAGKVAQLLVNLAVSVLTARYLGPANFGLIQYGAAYTGCAASLCNLGIPSVLVKELGDEPGADGQILGTALVLQGLSSILCGTGILCLAFVADQADATVLAVVGLSCVGMVFRILEGLRYWFQARLQCGVVAGVSLAAYTVAAVYKAVLLVLGKNVCWLALSTAVEYACLGVLYLAAYRKCGGGKLQFSSHRGRKLWATGRYFILPGLLASIYTQTDRLLLKQICGEQELGCYAAAVSISGAWCFVLSAVIDAMYPVITRTYGDAENFRRRNRQLYAVIFYLSMGMSGGIAWLAEPLVELLYGGAYLSGAVPLRILTWCTAFSYLGVARNAWVVCENRQKHLLWVYAAGAGVNVAVNLVLIPCWGAAGAAAASLAAQMVTALAVPLCTRGLRENAQLMLDAILWKGMGWKP